MNEEVFRQKLESLGGLAPSSPVLERLPPLLRALAGEAIPHLNPVWLAEQHGLDRTETLDAMVLGARVGLFDYVWSLVCPGCAFLTFTSGGLDEVSSAARHCAYCGNTFEPSLDEEAEVTFALSPRVAEPPDPWAGAEAYLRHHSSSSFERPAQLQRYLDSLHLGFLALPAGRSGTLQLDAEPGRRYRLLSLERGLALEIETTSPPASRGAKVPNHQLRITNQAWLPPRLQLPAGAARLTVANRSHTPVGVLLLSHDADELHRVSEAHPPRRTPHASGRTLINNQVFRDARRNRQLRPDLRLHIRDLTLLFTDLKESTALYAREGDGVAFDLIREHFRLLMKATRSCRGAIVKTMGDAVMATFCSAADGAEAACRMLKTVGELNRRAVGRHRPLRMGIGLHRGPVLLVNANERLDFFGQTVNVASRVQQLAGEGEVWYTGPVREALGGSPRGLPEEGRSVRLKGVGRPTRAYRVKI